MAANIKLGNGISMTEFDDGSVVFSDASHPNSALGITSHDEARRFAHAILAALEERVETRPDRSVLEDLGLPRWIVVRNNTIVYKHGAMALLDSLIDNLKSGPAGGSIYELQAWVEPRPVERKVVRVL